jgi:hypothetical protein
MTLPNVFSKEVSDGLIQRVQQLTPDTPPLWGKMNVAQMLAHCNVTYEYLFEPNKYKQPNFLMKWIVKTFVKDMVVNEKPYKHNSPTAPDFKVAAMQDFEREKTRLIGFIGAVQQLGAPAFEGKASHSFGKLSASQWNNMFYKHLQHHLAQFGV